MGKIREITSEDIHSIFCELMDCEAMENLTIIGYDNLMYFHALQEEGIEDYDVTSQYREENGQITMYVNEELLNFQPYYSVDIMMAQLFDIYADSFSYYKIAYLEATKLHFMKSPAEGYEFWRQFSSSYMAFMLLRKTFEETGMEDDEYSDDSLKEKYINILKELPKSNEEKDVKMSLVFYLLGRLAYLEKIPDDVLSIKKLNELEITDLTKILDGELGKKMNKLYKLFIRSRIASLKMWDYRKIAKLVGDIQNLISPKQVEE